MSVILFKTMIDPYLKPKTLTVLNRGAENATVTILFDDKNVMLGNSDKVLAVIDETTKTLYDVYKSELDEYKKVSGGWLAKIDITLFSRYQYKDTGFLADNTRKPSEKFSSATLKRIRYAYFIEGSDNNGDNANVNIFFGGATSFSYSFVKKTQGNKISKMWRSFDETSTDGFKVTQYPAGRNMSEIYGNDTVDRVVPPFIKMTDAQNGWMFKNQTRSLIIFDNLK